VRDGYTVVPDNYIEGMWTDVQGSFASAKYWCDYYAACRGFSQKDGDDQYWWLGTGDYTTGKNTRPAPGYTTYLKADGYTVVPDTYIEGMWTHVQGPVATAKCWCD
jgi:hypothetical protein